MSDSLSLDLENEDDIINLKNTSDDPFLYKLCTQVADDVGSDVEFNVDEGDDNVGEQVIQKGVQYPAHDPNVHWKLMKPRLGERYENPCQLKQCLINYSVANGYQLEYIKNDSERLLVKCGKGLKEHTCPFRLWASWMQEERSFQIKSINTSHYLIERDPNTWCRAFFQPDRACEAVENGICESFNSVIVDARRKPIITMLEEIRIFVMERNYQMSKKAQQWESVVCPAIKKKLKKRGENHRYWSVIPSGGNVFETRNLYEAMRVDLDGKSCSGRLWDISGIPCVHFIATIHFVNKDPEDYVSEWFKKDLFKMAYKHPIKPLNGSNMWISTPFIKPTPPKDRRMPGRPSIKRKRSESESQCTRVTKSGKTMTCRNCLEKGHNARTCKNEKKDPPPKPVKPKGRPRLNIPKPTTTRRNSRGGRGGRGRQPSYAYVGVSYDPITGEAMIGTSSGVPRQAWPNGILPRSVSSLEDQFSHEAQEDPNIGDEGEVDGVDESQMVDETLTVD